MQVVRHPAQAKLFDVAQQLPNGLVYRPDFLTRDEEEILLANIENMQLLTAYFRPDETKTEKYHSKRRHLGFGWDYDLERESFIRGEELPQFLEPMKRRIAKWLGISHTRVVEALINEYRPGAQIGWHRDRERFEHIIGISLAGWARMRFRPLEEKPTLRSAPRPFGVGVGNPKAVSVELEPRSAYLMQGDVRWRWQHSVAPVEALRYSITFRTLPSTK